MDESRALPSTEQAPSGWRQMIGGYAPLQQGDCQALAFTILHRCADGAVAAQPAARDGHPIDRRPAAR